jgi:hypothetical protein
MASWRKKEQPVTITFPASWDSYMEYQKYKIFKSAKTIKPSPIDPKNSGIHKEFSKELGSINVLSGMDRFCKDGVSIGIPRNYCESYFKAVHQKRGMPRNGTETSPEVSVEQIWGQTTSIEPFDA